MGLAGCLGENFDSSDLISNCRPGISWNYQLLRWYRKYISIAFFLKFPLLQLIDTFSGGKNHFLSQVPSTAADQEGFWRQSAPSYSDTLLFIQTFVSSKETSICTKSQHYYYAMRRKGKTMLQCSSAAKSHKKVAIWRFFKELLPCMSHLSAYYPQKLRAN